MGKCAACACLGWLVYFQYIKHTYTHSENVNLNNAFTWYKTSDSLCLTVLPLWWCSCSSLHYTHTLIFIFYDDKITTIIENLNDVSVNTLHKLCLVVFYLKEEEKLKLFKRLFKKETCFIACVWLIVWNELTWMKFSKTNCYILSTRRLHDFHSIYFWNQRSEFSILFYLALFNSHNNCVWGAASA